MRLHASRRAGTVCTSPQLAQVDYCTASRFPAVALQFTAHDDGNDECLCRQRLLDVLS